MAFAQGERSAYDSKASFLVSFGRFLSRASTERRTGSFDICLLGTNHFGRALSDAAGNATVEGRPVDLRQVDDGTAARSCDILFVSESEMDRTGELLQELSGTDVLTVSDMPDFVELGGMIQLVVADGNVRFEVNFDAAKNAGITLSPDLLHNASVVHRAGNR